MWLVTFASVAVSVLGMSMAGKGQSMPADNEERTATIFLGMMMFIGGVLAFFVSGYYLMSG